MKVKVAINGYGTIGKRVADAVSLQDDMEVVGITKTKPDFEARMGAKKYSLYAAVPDRVEVFEKAGIEVKGTVEDLLERADVVVDCSPGKVGAENKPLYERAGLRAVFQGGEKASVAETSFSALANYDDAVGKNFVRVVSCNTTGLARVLAILRDMYSIKKVRATMIRRVVDPKEDRKGLQNGIMPDPVRLPSHHAEDVKTVLPDVNIVTTAFKVPTTLMHLHSIAVETDDEVRTEDVIARFQDEPRIMLFSKEEGFTSTARIVEFAREYRLRYDLFENAVWMESINFHDGELYITQAIHQEAIVVPENIDAIRAMFELADKRESVRKTNKTLGII